MIPYVEIIDRYTLKKTAIVEPQECWFELDFQEYGEFEIYCRATRENLIALRKGRFVKIPNKRFIWYITAIKYTFTAGGAKMISATGYEAKWLLTRRCILTPKELSGDIASACYGLVNQALGTGANAARKVNGFVVDTNKILIDITGTQAPRGNLGEFVRPLLKQYNCGDIVTYENGQLKYSIYVSRVKTQTVQFAQSFDNLLSSEYFTDDAEKATYALVLSEVEDVEYTKEYNTDATGIDRCEVYVESDISTKYEDANGNELETTPSSDLYQGWLVAEGKNALAERVTIEEITGEIDLANSKYEFDKDYFVGDLVRVQDEYFNFYVNAKISKYTFRQNAEGYNEDATYYGG